VTYQTDDSSFPNPERGFYKQRQVFPGDVVKSTDISVPRAQNITLIRVYFRIDNFRDSDLSQAALDSFENSLKAVRTGGGKIIPRFAYNFGNGADASLTRILGHIQQIKPILERNADVIAFLEAGFFGWWGEWHDSTNNLNNVNAKKQIAEALLAALPANRMIVVRYNFDKREMYGNTALSEAEGFSNASKARIGQHNDCLGASDDDWGTYSWKGDHEAERTYMNLDNRFVPQGGETCNPDPRCEAPFVMTDLQRMRWDTINLDFEETCIGQWKSSGNFAQIEKSLGYRLRLAESKVLSRVAPGGTLSGTLAVVNEGWGKVFNARKVVLVLRPASGADVRIDLPTVDPRRWLKGATIQVPFSALVPANAPTGTYALWLGLLDPADALTARPEYAIRLANATVWDAGTGLNNLKQTVQVAK
jgi:hypothetical protein